MRKKGQIFRNLMYFFRYKVSLILAGAREVVGGVGVAGATRKLDPRGSWFGSGRRRSRGGEENSGREAVGGRFLLYRRFLHPFDVSGWLKKSLREAEMEPAHNKFNLCGCESFDLRIVHPSFLGYFVFCGVYDSEDQGNASRRQEQQGILTRRDQFQKEKPGGLSRTGVHKN